MNRHQIVDRHQVGAVWVVGRGDMWAWIEDGEGNTLLEIDCGLDLVDSPQPLREDVKQAYEWAIDQNESARQGERDYSIGHGGW